MTYNFDIYWPARKCWFTVTGETKRDALASFKRQYQLTRMPMGHVVRKAAVPISNEAKKGTK